MVQRAKRTKPAAKKPAKNNRQNNRRQGPQERFVKRMRRKHSANSYQGVKLKKPINRPTSKHPQFFTKSCDNAEPEEHHKKENLAYSSSDYDFHKWSYPVISAIKGFSDS